MNSLDSHDLVYMMEGDFNATVKNYLRNIKVTDLNQAKFYNFIGNFGFN